jgi:hypothetical protein
MVYKTRMLMDYIHRPVSSIDHDVSETGSVSETSISILVLCVLSIVTLQIKFYILFHTCYRMKYDMFS